MNEREFNLHDGKVGSAITVQITPRASSNKITGILNDGTIQVQLNAAQQDEKMNQLLIAFLSEVLEVQPNQLEVISGQKGSDKLITILDLDKSIVQERIFKHLK